jgi:hypothetical protein
MYDYDKDVDQSYSFRLLKRMPSFIGGFASLLGVPSAKALYNYDKSEMEADANALWADWWAIGDDLRCVLKEFENGQHGSGKKGQSHHCTAELCGSDPAPSRC